LAKFSKSNLYSYKTFKAKNTLIISINLSLFTNTLSKILKDLSIFSLYSHSSKTSLPSPPNSQTELKERCTIYFDFSKCLAYKASATTLG